MRWSIALGLAVLAVVAESRAVLAQLPQQCAAFIELRDAVTKKASLVREAMQKKADRKEICTLMTRFYAAEETMVKFLEKNKTWCGIPEQAITNAKAGHERSLKFRTAACTEGPVAKPRGPSLSDSIDTLSVDTAGNTKTGRGTLDSLNGNPLGK